MLKRNTIYILPIIGIGLSSLLGFQRFGAVSSEILHVANKKILGSEAGFTGAPGESNCVSCHNTGQVQNGDTENITQFQMSGSAVSNYLPNNSLDITITTASNVSKKGFQMTALDANNNPAGIFVSGANTQLKSGSIGNIAGRKYITHTSSTNSPNGWSFSWDAPATDVGPITFYLATNKSNGSGTSAGDVIYLSQYTLNNASASLVEKKKDENDFQAGFSPSTNMLFLNFETDKNPGELFLNIVDLNGKSVFTSVLGKSKTGKNEQNIVLPSTMTEGMYIVNLFVDNFGMQQKIRVIK